ncbi:FimD/PapC N-terminal domain-containing protein, partial [Escherichia coli]|uniref:FimD/PapC N-terminal domain-containing protein n=1 Tax=Escherichia coli TaxID=562 RepID=UPI003BA13C04
MSACSPRLAGAASAHPGQAKQVDLAAFSNGNPMVAGNYRVDVYVNGAWQGRR